MEAPRESGFGLGREEIRRRRLLPKALLVGLVAGVIAAGFRLTLAAAEGWRLRVLADLPLGWRIALGAAIGAAAGAAALWLVRRFAPEAAGSGIPQIKSVVLGETALRWRPVLAVKFLAGAIGIGGGFALGREGPTIQLGGASGLMVSEWLGLKQGLGERKALISAGAGAGLAAAFNAPLSGMVFVLEELHGSFTPAVFVAAFLAAVTADVVARLLAGSAPIFSLNGLAAPGLGTLPAAAVVGLVAGVGGVAFNRCLLYSLDCFDRLRRAPAALTGGAVGLVAGIAGAVMPGIAGTGGGIVGRALDGRIALAWLPLLLVVRFGLTMVSYGCGAAGGIFLPLFVIGALGGLSLGGVFHAIAPVWHPHPEVFVVLGMGALFTAIVRAPLTGLVLMIELTGTYEFMLPVLVSCFVAYGVADGLGNVPIYEALRLRAGGRPLSGANVNPDPGEKPPVKSKP